MGISASQARFLGLTARKANIEYEGQQVNQARTALANESANVYNRMYTIAAPIPPDVTKYYKTEYSYKEGSDTYTIQKYTKNDDGETYTVTVSGTTVIEEPYAATHTGAYLQQSDTGYLLSYGSSEALVSANPEAKQDIQKKYGLDTDMFYSYTNKSNNKTYYIPQDEFETMLQTLPWKGTLKDYYYADKTVTQTYTYDDAEITFDEDGKMQTILVPEQSGTEIDVTGVEVEDKEAYDAAMSSYEHQRDLYNKEIAQINSETEKIQQEDRSLELRLRQLDTERNAVDKELETVQSMLKSNIEKVFKLFD